MSLGDHNLYIPQTSTNISQTTITIGDTVIYPNMNGTWIIDPIDPMGQQTIPYNGMPGGQHITIGNTNFGNFINPKFALNEAMKAAIKSGMEKEEIEKMMNEALCEEVVDS